LKAIDFHKKHAAKTDIEGKFTAFTNLGIIYATLCIWTEAAKFHKKALRCATFVQSSPDQCIAVGNLGFLLFRRKKMVVAKACISRSSVPKISQHLEKMDSTGNAKKEGILHENVRN
jgi:hypothetical protein